MRKTIKLALVELAMVVLLLGLLGACFLVPINCDPSRNPELDKPLVEDPRDREMYPATAKTIAPPPGRDLVRPSEVWKN